MQNVDRLPAGDGPLEDVDAGFAVFIHAHGILRHTQAGVGREDHVCRLLAQHGDVLHILVALQHQQAIARLVAANAADGHGDRHVEIARERHLHRIPGLDVLCVRCRHQGHVIPRVAVDQLADGLGVGRFRGDGRIVLRGHRFERVHCQHGFIAVHSPGEVARRGDGHGLRVAGGLLLQGFQLALGRVDLLLQGGGVLCKKRGYAMVL